MTENQTSSASLTAAQQVYRALTEQAEKASAENTATAEKLRSRADAFGKAVWALGTTAVGWISLKEAADVFPAEDGTAKWLASLTIACLALMALSALYLARRFNRLTRPVSMSLNIAKMSREGTIKDYRYRFFRKDLRRTEASKVAQIYGEFGQLNAEPPAPEQKPPAPQQKPPSVTAAQLPSSESLDETYEADRASELIYDYARQALVYDREAEAALRSGDPERVLKAFEALPRSAQIRAEVRATMTRAAVAVIRDRTARATTGARTLIAIAVFAAGLIAVPFLADAAAAHRNEDSRNRDRITACATAAATVTEKGYTIGTGAGQVPLPGCDELTTAVRTPAPAGR